MSDEPTDRTTAYDEAMNRLSGLVDRSRPTDSERTNDRHWEKGGLPGSRYSMWV